MRATYFFGLTQLSSDFSIEGNDLQAHPFISVQANSEFWNENAVTEAIEASGEV